MLKNKRKYLVMVKGGMMEGITFRFSYLISFIGNLIYLVVIYSIWRAIFASNLYEPINGMNFYETMIYLVLAAGISNFIEVQIVWEMDRVFQTGRIVLDITKPLEYPRYLFWEMMGRRIDYFLTVFTPIFIMLVILTDGTLKVGLNIVMFLISIGMAIVISFFIDFIVGILVFYAHATWGINTMKMMVVSLLSGSVVPITFFPAQLKKIVHYLPFRAIYDIPISILLNKNIENTDYIKFFLIQIFWCLILAFLGNHFWQRSKKEIVINGG